MPRRPASPRFATAAAVALAAAAMLAPWVAHADVEPAAETNPEAAQPLPECEVIARVNGQVILACELEWQVQLMFRQRFGDKAGELMGEASLFAGARRNLLERLTLQQIDLLLLYADFRSKAPHADLAGIHRTLQAPFEEKEIPRLMEVTGVEQREELETKLVELGTSLAERQQEYFRTMIARSWLTESIEFDRETSHEQMLTYYREHRSEFDQPLRARWEELMVRFDRHPSKADAWRELATIGNLAHKASAATPAGEPAFAEIAPERSHGFTAEDGGEHEWTASGSLAAQSLDDALFNLPVGQMSPILEGPLGFHIVRVIDRREAGPTPFREVQAEIRAKLRDERFGAAVSEKLADLKVNARIWTAFHGDVSAERLAELQSPDTQQR